MRRSVCWMVLAVGVAGEVTLPGAVPVVTGFNPQHGWPGTQVSVEGSGFTDASSVQFNNTFADFEVVSATRLTATVPLEATVGPIRVSAAGGTGGSGSQFFLPAPRLETFTPTRGAVNTTVVIEGYNFASVREVFFGTRSSVFSVPTVQQIRAAVPSGLTNPVPITVSTDAGSVTSVDWFKVTGPAPIIDEIVPSFGAPGTQVAILGANFTNVTSVTFGGKRAPSFNAPTPARINTIVPNDAVSGVVGVTTSGGAVNSEQGFEVTLLPVITNFFPEIGKQGTPVTLEGVNFSGAQNVWFGGVQVTAWGSPAPGQILTTVPQGAPTGKISVRNAAGFGHSETDFVIPTAPVILTVEPWVGQAGVTSVYITGFNLNGASLWFNGLRSGYTVVGSAPEAIRATVPLGATTGPLSMTNAAGGFVTSQDFSVYGDSPFMSGMVPDHGPRGSQVRLEGGNFFPPVTVRFNGVEAPDAAAVSPSQILVNVPATATSGSISVSTPHGTTTNTAVFHLPPRLSSFSPMAAPEGAVVTLQGANLGYATAVEFGGGVQAEFEPENVVEGKVVKATVPASATNGPIRVVSPGGVVLSSTPFTVAPNLTSFVPELGPPLTPIVLYGTSFVGVGSVFFNGRAASFTVVSVGEIRAIVPAAVSPGPGSIRIVTVNGTAESAKPFYVTTGTDLELTLDKGEVVLDPGEEVTFAYSLRNRGTSPGTSVRLEEILPPGLTHVSAEASQGSWQATAGGVLFDVGVLMNGETATFSTTSRAALQGSWTNHVLGLARMAESDWDPANDRVRLNLAVVDSDSLVLDIVPGAAEGQVVIRWPVPPFDLRLESTTDPSMGTGWDPVSGNPTLEGGLLRLNYPVTGEERYFRLRHAFPASRDAGD